ncbi:patatin-like phospholipase family protein [Dyella silvatica]|uniref:patatin-like phospholipase family protein n=1 Tax=Dyella silvatica TaxID=2992128 RepID=UPI00224F88F9|nr:patatin-like phospholipase family protein [Dyella silvatica]
MHIGKSLLSLVCLVLLAGCVTQSRQPPPPTLISSALPVGFDANVRIVTTDRSRFSTSSPPLIQGLRRAAHGGAVNILALSGGGSGGAFGAGALAGMSRGNARPDFQLVTGVSAGALIAPFAFLGPAWDPALQDAFGGERSYLIHSATSSFLARLAFPSGMANHGRLYELVDHFVTPEMVAAVAAETLKGRRLIIATTDLDKRETVLWDMGVIAARGDAAARLLFRDVLVASASVPGMFPPVIIHVSDGLHSYDELHVDGSVTTPLFITPLVADIVSTSLDQLNDSNVYVIVNSQLASPPHRTSLQTPQLLGRSFSAQLMYKTKETIAFIDSVAREHHMHLRIAVIPADYPDHSFADFRPKSLQRLFDYAADCAARGRLWATPAEGVQRDQVAVMGDPHAAASCPGLATTASDQDRATQ